MALQVGGGLLILLMALSMLQGQVSPAKSTPEEAEETSQWSAIAVVPIGIPILAGAGAMSTVIVFGHHAKTWADWSEVVVGIFVNAALTWAFLRFSTKLYEWLGTTGVNVIGRLMEMLLVAMAVQFMANGLHGLFPALG